MMKVGYILVVMASSTTVWGVHQPFKLGVELLSASLFKKITHNDSCTVALITNQTGVNQRGEKTIDTILGLGVSVGVIFAPEHGLHGTIAAEKEVPLSVDTEKNIPVMSLYAHHMHEKQITTALKKVDLLVFDIQDSGMRHYTYISTLFKALHLAARINKPIIVLDRPNPLGIRMEGPLVNSISFSEIAALPIPLRHSMTVGEIALYCNKYVLKKPIDLHVVAMQGYHRKRGLSDQFLAHLSPNIQSLQACFGYSFLGLLGEVRPFDVGVGTDKSFQCIGLPDDLQISHQTWKRVVRYLNKAHVQAQIISYFNERKKKPYTGLRLSIADINAVPSFMILMNILTFFKQEGVSLSFSRAFDIAIGTKKVRNYILGVGDKQYLAHTINEKLNVFYRQAKSVFCYKPHPTLGLVN